MTEPGGPCSSWVWHLLASCVSSSLAGQGKQWQAVAGHGAENATPLAALSAHWPAQPSVWPSMRHMARVRPCLSAGGLLLFGRRRSPMEYRRTVTDIYCSLSIDLTDLSIFPSSAQRPRPSACLKRVQIRIAHGSLVPSAIGSTSPPQSTRVHDAATKRTQPSSADQLSGQTTHSQGAVLHSRLKHDPLGTTRRTSLENVQ